KASSTAPPCTGSGRYVSCRLGSQMSQAHAHHSPKPILVDRAAPFVGPVNVVLPPHTYGQHEIVAHLAHRWRSRPKIVALLEKLHDAVEVKERHLALTAVEYGHLGGFGGANDAFIRVGTELGAEAVAGALASAGLGPSDLDAMFFTTVTGVAAPTIDARIVNRLGLRRDIRRTPMFGLGCV